MINFKIAYIYSLTHFKESIIINIRGEKILRDVIDIPLKELISGSIIKKLQKQNHIKEK